MQRYIFGALALTFCSSAMAQVTVTGTSGNDTIVVGDLWKENLSGGVCFPPLTNHGPAKYVNGTVTSIALGSGQTLTVNGGAGDDLIEIPNTTDGNFGIGGTCKPVLKPFTSITPGNILLNGEGGDDEIHGSDGLDIIQGGADSDVLFANGGGGSLFGNTNINPCAGNKGTGDTCVGGSSGDFMICDLSVVSSGPDICDSDSINSCTSNNDFCGDGNP